MIINFLNDICHANINHNDVIDDNILDYNKLYKHDTVVNTLLYRWVYIKLLGTEPSKFIINSNITISQETSNQEQNIIELSLIIKDIASNTVLRFMNTNIPNTAKDQEQSYAKFKANVIGNVNLVKTELFNMLQKRNATNTNTFNPDKTLYSMFKPSVKSLLKIDTNPYTNCTLTPFTLNCKFETYTDEDIIMNALARDAYFSLKLSKYLIIGDTYDNTFVKTIIKHYKPDVIMALKPDTRNPYANYIVSKDLVKLISVYRPTCRNFSILYIDDEDNNTGGTRISPFNAHPFIKECALINETAYTDIADIFYKGFFDLKLDNKVTGIHPVILERIFTIFINKLKNKKIPDNKQSNKNCILAIDNRANILTAVSAYISRCALPDNDWNVVICTKPAHFSYYKSILGDSVEFITHKQQYVDEFRKFNQEDHNTIMKDPELWKQLLKYEKCLTVQDDGILFKEGIERFMDYDYVGAPWYINEKEIADKGNSKLVGNGGLSLRNVRKIHDIAVKKYGKDENFCHNFWIIPEDVMFSSDPDLKIPTRSEAAKFAFEERFNIDAIGFHKPWAYCKLEDIVNYLNTMIH